MPLYDTGAWSYYSRGAITRESDLSYHVLLRDFLASLCDRTLAAVYCGAEANFTTYLTVPPALTLRTLRVRGGERRALTLLAVEDLPRDGAGHRAGRPRPRS